MTRQQKINALNWLDGQVRYGPTQVPPWEYLNTLRAMLWERADDAEGDDGKTDTVVE